MTERAAMILAAGFGTRMGTLTRDRPKPLIQVAGQALIDHAVEAAEGAEPLVVNGHYRADQMQDHLARHHEGAVFLEEAPDILDSGGAVKHALPHLGPDPILTLNADVVWAGPSPKDVLEATWDPARMEALMLLVPRSDVVGLPGGREMVMKGDGRLTWSEGPEGLVYTGAQIITTDRIAAYPETVFSLRDIWQAIMDDARLFGCIYPGRWADVGQPEGITAAEAMLDAV